MRCIYAQDGGTYVTERSTHDDGLVAVLLVVVEDLLNGLDTGILLIGVVGSGLVLLVPVENLQPTVKKKAPGGLISVILTRPTKGEIKVAPASAEATAWPKLKRRVRLT